MHMHDMRPTYVSARPMFPSPIRTFTQAAFELARCLSIPSGVAIIAPQFGGVPLRRHVSGVPFVLAASEYALVGLNSTASSHVQVAA